LHERPQTRLSNQSNKYYLSEMSHRLPPLTALRAFEAAARHMSFARAAAELNVTPAALSFQIKSLEEHLGQKVFRRLNRAVALTEAGRALQPGTSAGFSNLSMAWRAARRAGDANTLTVTAGPAFTAKWLAPRLFKFARAHPEIELRFSASLRIMDFQRDEIDVAIRFGRGGDPGYFSKTIITEWLTPMMSPALAEKIRVPSDLKQTVLLHQDETAFADPPPGWATWFRAAGLGAPPRGGPQFSQPDHAIDAALSGSGVILGRFSLAFGALSDGALVAPFRLTLANHAHYRIVCPEGAETRPQVKAFLDWVLKETAGMQRFDADRHIVDVAKIQA
jgi:LysR family transcriptional regulator, glycine cleavage system transcriptional activator